MHGLEKTGKTRRQIEDCLIDAESGQLAVMVCRSPGARYEHALARHITGRRRWHFTEREARSPCGHGRVIFLTHQSSPDRLRGMRIARIEFDHAIGGAGVHDDWWTFLEMWEATKDL